MLGEVVGVFLKSVTERDFDGPLLALLAAQGFTDVHFIHGAFEFGKDVIAKKEEGGAVIQYVIQSKAGDIGQAGWREVRPQLEESQYNSRAHPNFDADIPRVVVLLTTGRLKGSATVDAQEFAASAARRGLPPVVIWDRQTLSHWIGTDPGNSVLRGQLSDELLGVLASIGAGNVDEPLLERYSRRWGESGELGRAALEGAIITQRLRQISRTDLAAYTALHLLRAARRDASRSTHVELANQLSGSTERLFQSFASELLDSIEPLLSDPTEMVQAFTSAVSLVSYPVAMVRIAELLALLYIIDPGDPLRERAGNAVVQLAGAHPGVARPVSDQFAVSLMPIVAVLARTASSAAYQYTKQVAKWMLDRSDPALAGLGLGATEEPAEVVVSRLLGGALERTELDRRSSSYVATVLLDLCIVLDEQELFDDLKADLDALRVTPTLTGGVGTETWQRGGGNVMPVPHVAYGESIEQLPQHHEWASDQDVRTTFLLVASCRSRHIVGSVRDYLNASTSSAT